VLVSCLLALVVPLVDDAAGEGRLADGAAGPVVATALLPLGNTSGGTALGGGDARGGGGGRGVDGRVAVANSGDGRADGAEADVGEDDVGVGELLLNLGGDTRGGGALAAGGTGAGPVNGVGRVEPEHVGVVVVPDGHDEDHGLLHGDTHLLESTKLLVDVGVAENFLLSIAVGIGDGVARNTSNGGLRVGNNLAVLGVEALDLSEVAGGVGKELGNDGDLLGGVDDLALAVEAGVALAVRVEVAAVGITPATIAVGAVGTAALVAIADGLIGDGARMGGEGSSHVVGLPDIHLRAASAVVTDTSVRVRVGRVPALNVGQAVDELDVTGALSIAVTGTVLGTGLVAAVLGDTTVKVHGDEVQGTVEAAANVGNINIEGELVVEEVEA